jgi:hypothetical protein
MKRLLRKRSFLLLLLFDFIVMKRVLILLFFSFLVSACSQKDKESVLVEKTMESFYKSMNKRDFETMKLYLSPRIKQKVAYFIKVGNELVVYKSFKTRHIEINGSLAEVEVECVDEFDNKIFCSWNLVKLEEEWKIDFFDFSSTESLN